MANKPPIIHINSIEQTEFGQGENFSAKLGRIGPMLGMEKMGCTLVELEAGKKAWPYHLHYGLEELFIIMEGNGSIRYDGDNHDIRAGDIIFAPTGEGTAHQIINTSNATLRYLAVSTMVSPDMCYYPDSGKYAGYAFTTEGLKKAFIAHENNIAGYWDGEVETEE